MGSSLVLLLGALARGADPAPRLADSVGAEPFDTLRAERRRSPERALRVEAPVAIPAGTFVMGNDHGAPDEAPAHEVRLDAFLMDAREVTQAAYRKLTGVNPSSFPGDDRPVDTVSWNDAVVFCNLRSRAEGLAPCYAKKNGAWTCDFAANGWRLPTEAEWEYACRAGSTSAYGFGNDPGKLPAYAWFHDNAGKATHPVGRKAPNAWGLYDLHGNVSEWCHDAYARTSYRRSPPRNPTGPERGDIRVVRGGGWSSAADECGCAARTGENARVADACITDAIGFRCVRRIPAR